MLSLLLSFFLNFAFSLTIYHKLYPSPWAIVKTLFKSVDFCQLTLKILKPEFLAVNVKKILL